MRAWMGWVVVGLMGCGEADQSFSNQKDLDDTLAGTATMTLTAEALVWTEMEESFPVSQTITLGSEGDTVLSLDDIRVVEGGSTFFFEAIQGNELAPGQTLDLTVTATIQTTTEATTGTLRFRTNDTTRPNLDVPLTAYPVGIDPPEDTGGDTGSDTGSDTGA